MEKGQNEFFEAHEMVWIGTINQKPAIRINAIGDILLISQTIPNDGERVIFIDSEFLELFTKTLLNYQMSRNGFGK